MRWRAALISMVMLYLGLQAPGLGHAALRLPAAHDGGGAAHECRSG